VDPASATAEALVEILPGGRGEALRPGLSVSVRLEVVLEPGAGSLASLPRDALGERELESGQVIEVAILNGDGAVERRPVRIGLVGDDRVEVRSGLAPGDKVVPEP